MNYDQLAIRQAQLEGRRKDIVNYKFMGGGFGAFFFLFISMGIGIIIWIITAVSNENELKSIDAELLVIKQQMAQAANTNQQTGDANEIETLKKRLATLETTDK